jgi:DNA-binding CsgD family transcriptional regulator
MMTPAETAVLDMIAQGIISVDSEGVVWRLKETCGNGGSGEYKDCKPRKIEGGNDKGYLRLCLNKRTRVRVHRIVWLVYKGEIPKGFTPNHKNGIKSDNRLENLELATAPQQMLHAVNVLGRKVGNRKNHPGHPKLTVEHVREILLMLAQGLTFTQVAEKFNVTRSRINQIHLEQIRRKA